MNTNKFRNIGKKISQLSFAKKFWLTFGLVIFIWQAVCFVQGAITARAMNYYCEKEAGIKLAEGTYYMEIPKDEYDRNCESKNKPFYCFGKIDSKEKWIEVIGSVKRDLNFGPRKDQYLSDYIKYDIGGLRKNTTTYFNQDNKI